ncbi:unnamed protein product [Mytilus coruscus]|uniref:B box-type domain-containing protein n=1 Tax=Mytilus coruscus TaxID=42192 RepID=A0A6J8CXZ2_MYTCO|nr:unnamed protein product [Mytilus coruscus]
MASNWRICGVCDKSQISKSSVVWCSDCDKGLCGDCKEYHSISKGTKDHETVSIAEYEKLPTGVLQNATVCKLHTEKYEFFCSIHDCPCCKKCLKSHNDCQGLTDINEIIKNIKTSNALYEIEQNLHEIVENIKRITVNRKENLTSLENKKREIEAEIKQTRTEVNRHLDKLQDDMIKELIAVEQKERSKIQKLLTSLSMKEKEITEYQGIVANIKLHASELQTYLVMKHIEKDIPAEEKYTQLFAIDTKSQINISFKMNQTLQEITISVHKFGDITVSSDQCDSLIQNRKHRQAQIMIAFTSRKIDNLTLSLKTRIYTDFINTSGCSVLPTGDTLDVVFIGDDSVAVTSGSSDQIKIIDLKTRQVKKAIKVNKENHGVVCKDGHLIYCADPENDRVICCDYHGKILWTFRELVLGWPYDISVDNDGIVFVVGRSTNNVVAISPDGQHFKQVLSFDDGLNNPQALHYDQSTSTLLVANEMNKAWLFEVKW